MWIMEGFSLREGMLQNFSSKGSSVKSFTNISSVGLGRMIFELILFLDSKIFDADLGLRMEDDDPFPKNRSTLASNSFRLIFQHKSFFFD